MPQKTLRKMANALLVGGGTSHRRPMPFRFENMWLKADSFKNLISEWWLSPR